MLFAFIGKDNFNLVIWISIFLVIISIVFFKIQRGTFLQIAIIFILFTYLFHFGQSLIITLGFDDIYAHRNVLSSTTYNTYINAELFSMSVIYIFSIGYLFSGRKIAIDDRRNSKFNERELFRIRKIALLILIIGIIPMIYSDVSKIDALISGGYLNTYNTYSSGIGKLLFTFGHLGRTGLLLLMFSLQKNKTIATRLLLLTMSYYTVMMLSGDRSTNMIYIISSFFIYFKYIKSMKTKHVIIGLIAIYFLAGFLSAISLFRQSDFSLTSFFDVFSMRSKDGIIYSCLREFGVTLGSLVSAIEYIPSYSNYNYGMTYITSIFAILPKLPDFLVEIFNNSFTFIHAFPNQASAQLAGSYIGELFYNFGWFGSIFSVFIGLIIGKIENVMNKSVNIKLISIYIVLLPSLLLWVRDFYCNLLFKTFWIGLLIYFLKVKSNEKNSNYNQ